MFSSTERQVLFHVEHIDSDTVIFVIWNTFKFWQSLNFDAITVGQMKTSLWTLLLLCWIVDRIHDLGCTSPWHSSWPSHPQGAEFFLNSGSWLSKTPGTREVDNTHHSEESIRPVMIKVLILIMCGYSYAWKKTHSFPHFPGKDSNFFSQLISYYHICSRLLQ